MLMPLLLTGCRSILVNGNLSFTAYEPVEPMESALAIKEVLLANVDFEKYNVDGETAFWMPPYHLNPIYLDYEDVNDESVLLADFKAVGYSEIRDRWVYAYLTPYFEDNMVIANNGLTIPKKGSVDGITVPEPVLKKDPGYVLVLMSYEPASGTYNVFYNNYYSNKYYQSESPSLIAGRVDGMDAYYIFDQEDMSVNVFDIDGNTLSSRSYYADISWAFADLATGDAAYGDWKKQQGTDWLHWRYTVSDVQVDEDLFVYFTAQVELSKKAFDDDAVDDMLDENDEDDEYEDEEDSTDYDQVGDVLYVNGSVSTFRLDIGGSDTPIRFTSSLSDEAKQACLEKTALKPLVIELDDEEKIDKAVEELKKEHEDTPDWEPTDEDIYKYLRDNDEEYLQETARKQQEYYSHDNHRLMTDQYYSSIENSMNTGFGIFDTSEMQDVGLDIYYALAGIPDLNDIRVSTPDGDNIPIQDVRKTHSGHSIMEFTFDSNGNMRHPNLGYAVNVTSSYLASRAYLADEASSTYTRQYMLTYHKPLVDTMVAGGNISGYFLKYGNELMYPFLTPGDFRQTVKDESRPQLGIVNRSPYAAFDSAKGEDGFYHFTAADNVSGPLMQKMPIVLVYGGTEYQDGASVEGYQIVENMSEAVTAGKFTYPLPAMVVDETMTVDLHMPVEMRLGDYRVELPEMSIKADVPVKYRMVFPEGTCLRQRGEVWVGEGIKAVQDLGCVTYKDKDTSKRAQWGYPYDDLIGREWYPDVDDDSNYAWIQQMHLGKNGAIFDESAKGIARDVGNYTLADGSEELVYILDETLRFYAKENGRYKAFKEVDMDTIRRVSGYGLNIEDENKAADGEEKTSSQKMADAAMEQETQEYNLLAENLMPYSRSKLMICHEGDGISLYDTNGETLMKLMGGHYYRIFPTSKSGQYVLLGFQSEAYDYTPGDISMAKYYVIDLGKLINNESNSNITSYIDELRDLYHSKTHTIRYLGIKNGKEDYEIVPPDESDPEYARAKKLLTGSETETLQELTLICAAYGVNVTEEMRDYALKTAATVQEQRKALNRYYELIGIQMKNGGIPDHWQYLMNESRVFTASYEGMLEIMLVETVLSDYYLDTKVTNRISNKSLVGTTPDGAITDKYIELKRQYRDWQETRKKSENLVNADGSGGAVSVNGLGQDELQSTIMDLYLSRMDESDAESITEMEFYQEVLRDITEKYEETNDTGAGDLGETGAEETEDDSVDFEEYMDMLFKSISPDYGQDIFEKMQESGYEQFFLLAKLPRQNADNESILPWSEASVVADLARCRYEWQVEEVMVKYQLQTAAYHDNEGYQKAWEDYVMGEYDGDDEKKKAAFEKCACHAILDKLKKDSVSLGTGKTWNESIADILRKAGNSMAAQ